MAYLIGILAALGSWYFFIRGHRKPKFYGAVIQGTITSVKASVPLYIDKKRVGTRIDFQFSCCNAGSVATTIEKVIVYVDARDGRSFSQPMVLGNPSIGTLPIYVGPGEYLSCRPAFYVDNVPSGDLDLKTVSIVFYDPSPHVIVQDA